MSASAPPTWHWRDECYVPVEAPEPPDSATLGKQNGGDALSEDPRNLSESDVSCVENDSPDPTYQGCRPSERYPSDATGCERTAQLTDSVINAAPSRRIGTRYEDPDTGEHVMPADFCGEKELRWMPDRSGDRHDAEPLMTAESCPECGAVTDIEYGTLMAEGYRDPDVFPKRETVPDEETSDVPFGVQSWLFEALIESEINRLHEIIDDHHDEILEMARKRHREGFVAYGSKGYSWDAKTRLRNVLEELSDGGTYLTMGPIE